MSIDSVLICVIFIIISPLNIYRVTHPTSAAVYLRARVYFVFSCDTNACILSFFTYFAQAEFIVHHNIVTDSRTNKHPSSNIQSLTLTHFVNNQGFLQQQKI